MVEKQYLWSEGAALEEHSKRKLKVLREYFARYLAVRCQHPRQSRFRLAIVEGFSGGGRYKCGTAGSPLVFVEELRVASEAFNLRRVAEGMSALDIECLLILNDESHDAISLLKTNLEPLLASIKADVPKLHLHVEYRNAEFENVYSEIKSLLIQGRYHNVIFNLDQCGHSGVNLATLVDITNSFSSAEIFYTFAIASLLAFLQKSNPAQLSAQLKFLGATAEDLRPLEGVMSNKTWLGAAERMVFETFRNSASYVSPFSINNPGGWRYWLIHFANSHRARQEYNNILHKNSSMQAHFGRSGLNMLSFDPEHSSNELYLFGDADRERAAKQLFEDIPRFVTDFGDTVRVNEFYEAIYKMTPAHMDDIHVAMIQNPDLEVITEAGGVRQKANTIETTDILRMKGQRSFFPIFFGGENPKK
jgi:three-Cys-motif partner protein